ncbi:unknown [Bacteroides sp. CAG:144]|nr:unknown [Bacteroides sp. CAG:144]
MGGRIFQMGAYHTVPILAVNQLYPRHIKLHERGTAPLPCFQQDKTHGLSRPPLRFEPEQQFTLRTIQAKRHIAVAHLVFDTNEHYGPKLEIVANTHFHPTPPYLLFPTRTRCIPQLFFYKSRERTAPAQSAHKFYLIEHFPGDILHGYRGIGQMQNDAFTHNRSFTGFGTIRLRAQPIPTVIFFQYRIYIVNCSVHAFFRKIAS